MPEVDFAGTIDADNDLIGTLYKPAYAVFGHILPSHHIVTGQGALCEYVAVSPSWITRKPDRLSFGQAAALPTVGVSACKLLKHVPQHAKVFVNGGSGGVGTILLQLLKSVKNATVVSTASEQSADLVRNHLKADETVDYRTVGPLGPHLAKHYGRSFDVCFDLVGDAQLYKASPSYIKSSGIYVAFGGGLEATSFFYLLKWLLATVLTGYWPKWLGGTATTFRFVAVASERETVQGLTAIASLVEQGLLEPVLDSVHSFENARHAYERLQSRHAHGKVVVTVP